MNPQQDLFYGGGYSMGNANRSPSLSRPGYGTVSSLQPPNRGGQQRQGESGGQNLPSLYGEDRFNTYDTAFRTTRLHPNQGFPDPFMVNNNQGWGFHPGAATVNGAMGGDGNRLRPSNRRGQIPSVSTSIHGVFFFAIFAADSFDARNGHPSRNSLWAIRAFPTARLPTPTPL